MLTIIQILQVLLDVVWWIVIADFVLSILIAFNVVNTYNGFVRSLYDGIERLCLVSRGRSLAIAQFLGPDEKSSFASALTNALQTAKRGPVYNH